MGSVGSVEFGLKTKFPLCLSNLLNLNGTLNINLYSCSKDNINPTSGSLNFFDKISVAIFWKRLHALQTFNNVGMSSSWKIMNKSSDGNVSNDDPCGEWRERDNEENEMGKPDLNEITMVRRLEDAKLKGEQS